MKINLYGEDADSVAYARLVGGYESYNAVIRKMVKLYLPDFISRFDPTLLRPSAEPLSALSVTVAVPHPALSRPAPDPQAPQENPTPEW